MLSLNFLKPQKAVCRNNHSHSSSVEIATWKPSVNRITKFATIHLLQFTNSLCCEQHITAAVSQEVNEHEAGTASSLVQELSPARTELWFFAHSAYSPIPNLTKLSQLPFWLPKTQHSAFKANICSANQEISFLMNMKVFTKICSWPYPKPE